MKEGRVGLSLGRANVTREGAQGREGSADLSVAMLHAQLKLALLPHAILNIRYLPPTPLLSASASASVRTGFINR